LFDERGFPPRADLCLYGHYDKIRRKLRTLVDDLLEEVFTQRISSMLALVGNSIVAWEREISPGQGDAAGAVARAAGGEHCGGSCGRICRLGRCRC